MCGARVRGSVGAGCSVRRFVAARRRSVAPVGKRVIVAGSSAVRGLCRWSGSSVFVSVAPGSCWAVIAEWKATEAAPESRPAAVGGGGDRVPAAEPLAAGLGRYVPVAGALLRAAGHGWVRCAMDVAAPVHAGAWPLVPGLAVAGAGLGFLVVPLVAVVLSAAPAELVGGASGVFSTAQQFGGALGAAVIGTAYFADLSLGAAMPWALAAYAAAAVLSLRLSAGGR
ncbi:hypothetical protein [Streptomyces sp. NPDC003863]